MLKLTFLILLTIAAILLEPIVGSVVVRQTIRPDLLLVPLIVAVVVCPGPPAVVWGGVIGLVCDALSGPCLGPQMAAFAAVAAIGSLAMPRPRSILGIFLLSFFYALGAQTAALGIRLALEGGPVAASAWSQVAGSSSTTAILIASGWLVARRLTLPLARSRFDAGRIVNVGWQQSAD